MDSTSTGTAPNASPPPGRRRGGAAGTKGVPRAEREEQILAAALEEFGRHGHASASMAAIAGRVGVTKPMLYAYFDSKDGLYLACLEHIATRVIAAIDEAMAGGPAAPAGEQLPHAVLTGLFTALEDRRHAWFVLYDRTLAPGSELRLAAQRHRGAIDGLAASGTAALLSGHGNEDPLDADALKHVWTGTVSSLMGWWIAHPELSTEDMSARCARLLTAIRTA
ncbi:TetR/AcrR family transcriptional regulator [Streptomyces flavotricini]|uniref:TetR/AcrR family transcriptional regulator n=1 Tax=Streptomyces flavotricini TaxID=66888 RepID=A0ABS8DZX4_9ACTN|nr:TetR/AcrR family transcriptional regulator [Streptomyces flavotricini]MCC0094375.1 TetR/AcrR family transcriptional regulator [Streptomyces flavotricini]